MGGFDMKWHLGYSVKEDTLAAIEEACQTFRNTQPELVLFFSDSIRFERVAVLLHGIFPKAVTMGASTYASFSLQGLCRNGINVMALIGGGDVRICANHIDEITKYPMKYKQNIERAVSQLEPLQPGTQNTVCFLLNPAGTGSEELVLDTIGEVLHDKHIPVVGGSASSEACVTGKVSLNGRIYADSSVFALIQLSKGHVYIYQENIFKPMDHTFTITRADVDRRTIYELDGHPAAEVLCRALQVPFDQLALKLVRHPFGRIPDNKLFVDEVERVNQDGSITTFCRVFNQSQIVLLEPCDCQQTLSQTLAAIHAEMPVIDSSIIINCYSRTQMFLQNGWMDEFLHVFGTSMGAYIGLTSHGEQLGDYQLNLTLLVLSFGGTV